MLRAPVVLARLEGLARQVPQTKKQLYEWAVLGGHHVLGGIDLRVFMREPQRGIGQINEVLLVIQQLEPGGATGRRIECRQIFRAGPPEFGDPVVGRFHATTGRGQRVVNGIVQRVQLDVPVDFEGA